MKPSQILQKVKQNLFFWGHIVPQGNGNIDSLSGSVFLQSRYAGSACCTTPLFWISWCMCRLTTMKKCFLTWNQIAYLVFRMDFFLAICSLWALTFPRTSVWLLYVPREWVPQSGDYMFKEKKSMVLELIQVLQFTRSPSCPFSTLVPAISFMFNLMWYLLLSPGYWWEGHRCCSRVVCCPWFSIYFCNYSRAGV